MPDLLIHAVRKHVDQLNLIQVSRSQGGSLQDTPLQDMPSQGSPTNMEAQPELENNGAGYEALFDRQVTSSQRINSLLHLLEVLSPPPAGSEV